MRKQKVCDTCLYLLQMIRYCLWGKVCKWDFTNSMMLDLTSILSFEKSVGEIIRARHSIRSLYHQRKLVRNLFKTNDFLISLDVTTHTTRFESTNFHQIEFFGTNEKNREESEMFKADAWLPVENNTFSWDTCNNITNDKNVIHFVIYKKFSNKFSLMIKTNIAIW